MTRRRCPICDRPIDERENTYDTVPMNRQFTNQRKSPESYYTSPWNVSLMRPKRDVDKIRRVHKVQVAEMGSLHVLHVLMPDRSAMLKQC